MPFRSIVDPDELALLQRTLDQYCAENGIGPEDPERDRIAHRIFALFTSGVANVEELKRQLNSGRRLHDN